VSKRSRTASGSERDNGAGVSTQSGPGSPRGQPAWGGGCDGIKLDTSIRLSDPLAIARGTDTPL